MRSDDLDSSARTRDAMKLGDERHHIGHVLNDMTADDFIEFIRGKGVRQRSQIVNHIGMASRIGVHTDGTGELVLSATDIKDLFFGREVRLLGQIVHAV